MFLNVTATVANWSADNMECSLILEDNPLVDFVELPETCQGLSYCNILCGVLRGALEMVRILFNSWVVFEKSHVHFVLNLLYVSVLSTGKISHLLLDTLDGASILLLESTNAVSVQVSMRTEVKFVKDMLRGDDVFEIRLKLLEQMPEEYPYKNDE